MLMKARPSCRVILRPRCTSWWHPITGSRSRATADRSASSSRWVRGLAALGHRVTLLAQPGTKVAEAAKTVEVAPTLLKDSGVDLKNSFPKTRTSCTRTFP